MLTFGVCTTLYAALAPDITFEKGPLRPLQIPPAEQSVLLGHSAHQKSTVTELRYEPLEDGGFLIENGDQSLNRTITIGRNNVVTGDKPLFRMHTTTGSGVYPHAEDRSFPLFPRQDALNSKEAPALGTLRLFGAGGKPMDQSGAVTSFRPGYTQYELRDASGRMTAQIVIAPAVDHHGFVCRVEFDKPSPLAWTYDSLYLSASDGATNLVELL